MEEPVAVVDAYRLAMNVVPKLQLAPVGTFAADDDSKAPVIYRAIRECEERGLDVHCSAAVGA